MGHKLKQFTIKHRFIQSNHLANQRSRVFFLNHFRNQGLPGKTQTVAGAIFQYEYINISTMKRSPIKTRISCFVSNRSRGVSRRFRISRLKIKFFMHLGMLTGFKKAS
jgi:ribosomal protein S14